jgi:hypothetical protein
VKRSRTGLVLIILGLVTMIVLAPLAKWVVAPMLVKIPDTLDVTTILEGELRLAVDPASLSLLPPGMEVKIPLTTSLHLVSDKSKGSGKVAVIKVVTIAKGPGGKDFQNITNYYAVDRKTGENVSGNNSDVNRTGYPVSAIGFFVDPKKPYSIFDDEVGKAEPLTFVKSEKVSGFTYKNVDVQLWKSSYEDKTVQPPLGLFPAKLSGAQIKALMPSLTSVNDNEMYPVEYIKTGDLSNLVDQMTGSVFDVISMKYEYFVDATALGMGKIKLATVQQHQTAENAKEVLDYTAKAHAQINAIEIYIPVGLLIIGLIELIIGLILYLRKKPA